MSFFETMVLLGLLFIFAGVSVGVNELKKIWGLLFDIHIAVALREDPKKYGGGKIGGIEAK